MQHLEVSCATTHIVAVRRQMVKVYRRSLYVLWFFYDVYKQPNTKMIAEFGDI